MKSRIFLFTAILSLIFIAGNIFSQEFRGRERDRDEMGIRDRIEEKLNLTDDQVNKIESLRLDNRKDMIGLRADVEKKEIELEELKNTINYSRDEYLKKVNEIISVKNNIDLARANHQMDIYQLLDENQKKEWNKMTHKMHDRKHRIMRKMKEKSID